MIRPLTFLLLLASVAGCSTRDSEVTHSTADSSRNPQLLAPDLYPDGAVPEQEPVVRYGRYTLVSTQPDAGQRDLMAQIIDVTIPSKMRPSVQDAMQYVMDRSGYALCPPTAGHVNILYTRPLPAAQYKLGPMTLRNSLQVLAGPAWQVKVDEVRREVCFVLRPGYQSPAPGGPASSPVARQIAQRPEPAVDRAGEKSPATVVSLGTDPVQVAATPEAPPLSTQTADESVALSAPPSSSRAVPTKAATTLPDAIPQVIAPTKEVATPANQATTPNQVATRPAATPSAPPPPPPQAWTAEPGSTLRDSIEAWAKRAHWRVLWRAEGLDYPIEAPLRFEGSFLDAIGQIFPLYDRAPRAFYVNVSPPSQRLIEVVER